MELDFNKIIRLKKIRIEKSELSEEENILTSPVLKDKSLIHEIYKIFVELLNKRGCPPNIDSVTHLVLLFLFYRVILFLNNLILLVHLPTPYHSGIDGFCIQKEFLTTGKESNSKGCTFRISPDIFISTHWLFVNFINLLR